MKPRDRVTAPATNGLKLYRVNTGWKRWRYFWTLTDAKIACERVFARTGVVLCIENVTPVTDTRKQDG